MLKNHFQFQDQVVRTWPILDGIARRARELPSVSQQMRQEVSQATNNFHTQLKNATKHLPQNDSGKSSSTPPRGVNIEQNNWEMFLQTELIDMIGREGICSIADAFMKTRGLLRALQGDIGGHKHFLFRGQRDISWRLESRKARALRASEWIPPNQYLCVNNRTITLPLELDALDIFRHKWNSLADLDEIDRNKKLSDDDPQWWFRMQHYDRGDGTRLLDVTTSLTAALLFACINWNTGKIDDSTDGIIYLWAEGNNGNVDDFLLNPLPKSSQDLFTGHSDAPRYILHPPHTERSKAQSSAFLWWPKFLDDAPYNAPYYLPVNAEAKADIVENLLSMGFGPKEAVRGIKGLENECSLRKQLGWPSWTPLELKT